MGLGGLVKKLFGSAGDDAPEPGEAVEYNGFTITPMPKRHGGQFLTAGRITKSIEGEEKLHDFVRADTHGSLDDAKSFSLTKAQQIIDQMGDRLFDQAR